MITLHLCVCYSFCALSVLTGRKALDVLKAFIFSPLNKKILGVLEGNGAVEIPYLSLTASL